MLTCMPNTKINPLTLAHQMNIDEITKLSKIFLLIGGMMWVLSFLFFTFWSIIAEKVGFEYKYRYLHAVLRQEAAWFDEKDAQELPSKISSE